MQSVLLGLAVLACPVGMGVMMWMMNRGQQKPSPQNSNPQQLQQLRAEINELKAQRAEHPADGGW